MAMRMDTLRVCVLALLALCSCALARPTEEGAQANSATAPDAFPANCGHTRQGNVTAEEVEGVWYVLEWIVTQGTYQGTRNSRVVPCIQSNFTLEGTRLSLSFKMGDREETWSLDPTPSGIWERAEADVTVHLSSSGVGQLLYVCLMKRGTVRSYVLGRSPRLDEAAVTAARSPSFSSAQATRPDLQSCDALPAAVASNPLPS